MKKLLLSFLLLCSSAFADNLPLVVPFPAGGGTDGAARAVQRELTKELARPINVEYKTGAGGNIGAAYVASNKTSEPTLLVTSAAFGMQTALKRLPLDVAQDLKPIAYLGHIPLVLVATNAFPYKDLSTWNKIPANKTVFFGSAGVGTITHLNGELLKSRVNKDMVHVPYKGTIEVIPDLIAGRIDVSFEFLPTVINQIEAGQLTPIAVVADNRLTQLPNVPTFKEKGFKNFGFISWQIVMVNASANPAEVKEIGAALTRIINSEAKSKSLKDAGLELNTSINNNVADFVTSEVQRYQQQIKAIGNIQ